MYKWNTAEYIVTYFAGQVCATHPYTGEDGDELSFEAGEVIFVIEYEDPEEQVSHLVIYCVSQMFIVKLFSRLFWNDSSQWIETWYVIYHDKLRSS